MDTKKKLEMNSQYGKMPWQYWLIIIKDRHVGYVRAFDKYEALGKSMAILAAMPWIEPQAITVEPMGTILPVKGGDA